MDYLEFEQIEEISASELGQEIEGEGDVVEALEFEASLDFLPGNITAEEVAEEIRKIAEGRGDQSKLARNPIWRWRRMLDPLFKRIMSDKNVALDLINAMVYPNDEGRFVDLELLDKEVLALRMDAKMCRVDMLVKTETGEKINLEVQISREEDFARRSLYYWSLIHCDQLGRGKFYGEIKRTIAINLLAFTLLPNERDFRNVYAVCNEQNGNKLCNDLAMIFVEIPKFQRALKQGHKPKSRVDAWASFFADIKEDELMTIAQGETRNNIQEAMTIERMFLMDENERLALARGLMNAHYVLTHDDSIRREGVRKGIKEGMEIGMQKGVEKGKLEMAKNMLALGIEPTLIAQASGLPLEEIRALH